MNYNIDYLEQLEAEAVFILREVFEQFNNSCLLFSGGKDSIVLIRLAQKAFFPNKIPFKILHIDTGYNFDEVISFRDRTIDKLNLDLTIASVEDLINNPNIKTNDLPDRNRLQIPVLLDVIQKEGFDAAIGGGRRDEEKVRAKERVFSIEIKADDGIPKTKEQNCGICTMEIKTMESISGFFPLVIGRKWIFGIIYQMKIWKSPQYTFRTKEM